MIAAMMTAANLGARVTGWGFVVFLLGSLAWSTIGLTSGQTNLLATNAFLTLVNLVGIWRWLGRQRGYEDGGKSAERKSRHSASSDLLTATGLAGVKVEMPDGSPAGTAVEALIACHTGTVSYVVVGRTIPGGITEELRAVPRDALVFAADRLQLLLSPREFEALPVLDDGDWPAAPPALAHADNSSGSGPQAPDAMMAAAGYGPASGSGQEKTVGLGAGSSAHLAGSNAHLDAGSGPVFDRRATPGDVAGSDSRSFSDRRARPDDAGRADDPSDDTNAVAATSAPPASPRDRRRP
jgi:hypothetical protein